MSKGTEVLFHMNSFHYYHVLHTCFGLLWHWSHVSLFIQLISRPPVRHKNGWVSTVPLNDAVFLCQTGHLFPYCAIAASIIADLCCTLHHGRFWCYTRNGSSVGQRNSLFCNQAAISVDKLVLWETQNTILKNNITLASL